MSIVANVLAIALLASGVLTFPHSPKEKLSASHKSFTYPAVNTVADAYSTFEIGRQLSRAAAPTTHPAATAAFTAKDDNQVDEKVVARQDHQADCARWSSAALTERLRAAGFRVETHLLAQIADGALRAEVCSVYSAHLRSAIVAQCSASDAETRSPTLQLLATICERRRAALIDRNAECLRDVDGKLEMQCVVACRRQATAAAASDALRVKVADETREAEVLCKIGVCAVRCLNAQLAECEVTASDADRTANGSSLTEGDATSVALTPLQRLHERLSAAQMLLGVESDNVDGNALTALLKGGKVPTKCEALMRKAWDADVAEHPPTEVDSAKSIAEKEENRDDEEEEEDDVAAEVDNNENAPAVAGAGAEGMLE